MLHRTDLPPADIVEVIGYLAMDADLRALATQLARDALSAAHAARRVVDHHADALAALPDPVLAERAADRWVSGCLSTCRATTASWSANSR